MCFFVRIIAYAIRPEYVGGGHNGVQVDRFHHIALRNAGLIPNCNPSVRF